MTTQLVALALALAIAAAAFLFERWRASRSARRSRPGAAAAREPYVLYFSGPGCLACRTRQEPALARLPEVRVEKVDVATDPARAERFGVYTLPTTMVVGCDGTIQDVNSGYADPGKLRRQLARARGEAAAG